MTRVLLSAVVLGVVGCTRPAAAPVTTATTQATQANAQAQDIAPDSIARQKLVDLRRVVPFARFELRYATRNNFAGAVLPGYEVAIPMLRREAGMALARVQDELSRRGYGLKVWDGYRPVRATLAMVAWCERNHRVDLLDQGYIARRSRHNQGVAIDLTVVRLDNGEELAMGTPFDEFSARAHTANASGEIAKHREILGAAMRHAGFVNYVDEWWHFSFDVTDPMPFDLPLH